MHRCNQG